MSTKVGKNTKKEIMEACPHISKTTVERTLTDLVKTGYIAKVGSGPATAYVRIRFVKNEIDDQRKSFYFFLSSTGKSTDAGI